MPSPLNYTIDFSHIQLSDIALVGGKNASLGEMFQNLTLQGINVPDGYATTAQAYWEFIEENKIRKDLTRLLEDLDTKDFTNLSDIGTQARNLILNSNIPTAIQEKIIEAYQALCNKYNFPIEVAVRSSATAEDLPAASFAGQHESYLNIRNEDELLEACLHCFASLFTDRAIKYRFDNGFEHMDVALSIGIQKMVRSDKACAGVCFTIDPETGFKNSIYISGSWGLGENVVKGVVIPDEFYVFKPSLFAGKRSIISKKTGNKNKTLVYNLGGIRKTIKLDRTTINIETPKEKRAQFVLSNDEIEKLAEWGIKIENHYGQAMDIEWAKDGISKDLFIVQARPETVHSTSKGKYEFKSYTLKTKSKILCTGKNVGSGIAAGKARILHSPDEIDLLQEGEVLVTEITNPDWDPILKKAAAIITNRGGRTSHAAIVARETGAVAVVGAEDATKNITNGQEITISCIDGKNGIVYEGILDWKEKIIDTGKIVLPDTSVMFILADSDQAFKLSFLPNNGVGLLRLEFMINNSIQIHPMALVNFDNLKDKTAKKEIEQLTSGYKNKEQYFIDKLAQGVSTIAAAFYPKDVIVRMSDFKSNEYANLIGGKEFEPHEENPMLGWRGASRYYHENYKQAFELECKAMKYVRYEMGLNNVKLMIPFCRTPEEGKKVIDLMAEYGLEKDVNKLEIYVMIEIPSNVLLAEEFASIFSGFSIGSNDLTQLVLGIGRDSEILSDLFDVKNAAVKKMIAEVIHIANRNKIKIGLCGQAPSDFPEFAQFLVMNGINSVSFSPDALIKGIDNILLAESKLQKHKKEEKHI